MICTAGRQWQTSCRKDCLFSGPTAEADGTTVFSTRCERNPHDTRNEAHVFEYLEALIRVANQKYLTKEKSVAKRFSLMVKGNLKSHKTPNHVVLPDGKNDKDRWETLDPDVSEVIQRMSGAPTVRPSRSRFPYILLLRACA